MRKLTTDEVIRRSILKHGDRYDYSKVDYVKHGVKIEIICKKHGSFFQLPDNHIRGKGCPRCSGHHKTTEDIISEFRKTHGDKYEYDKFVYVKSSENSIITCKIHGDFLQRPSNHINGHGCVKCFVMSIGSKRKLNSIDFRDRAIKIHGNTYDYSLVDYKTSRSKIKILCRTHGIFEQKPYVHLQGSGCQNCKYDSLKLLSKNTPTGWSVSNWEKKASASNRFDSFKVYIIRCWNDEEEFYKIGRTFIKTQGRFTGRMPYNYEILNEFVFDNARECFNKENELKRLNKFNKYLPNIPFGGMHECFSEYPALE